MDLRLLTPLRLVFAALASVWFLSSASFVLADTVLYVPAAMVGATVGAEAPVELPPHRWSVVLNNVPLPVGFRLRFFDSDDTMAVSVARYEAEPEVANGAGAWYRTVMPALGWSPIRETALLQQWNRGGRRLDIRLPDDNEPGVRFECRPDCPRGADGWTVGRDVPLPRGATRLRFDPSDLFAEEVLVGTDLVEARTAARETLASTGWRSMATGDLAGIRVDRFVRQDDSVSVAVWPAGPESSIVGVGRLDCLELNEPWPDWPQPSDAVYVDRLPAPAASQIVGFSPDDGVTTVTERWAGACLDLDLAADLNQVDMERLGWRNVTRERATGSAQMTYRHASDGMAVTIQFSSTGSGSATTALTSPASGMRESQGLSLLFADLPVPPASLPGRLDTGLGRTWPMIEVYVPPRSVIAEREAYYLRHMPDTGWTFDRLEPAEVGPSQVYYSDGEEVVVGFTTATEDVPAVSISRRRVCPSDEVVVEPGGGRAAAHMAEMTVFPGATYEAFDAGRERYGLTCASLDVLVAWYRGSLEDGDWALASTVGPEDAFHRELLFVRPDERAFPPEQRTAWAKVLVDRLWPYAYRLTLQRDPSGVRAAPE